MRRIAPLAFPLPPDRGPVVAQMTMPTEAPGKLDPKRVVKGTYKIDPVPHSSRLHRQSPGLHRIHRHVRQSDRHRDARSQAPTTSKVEVTIPIAKVRTTSAELDTQLQAADFFDAAKFPTATFVSTKRQRRRHQRDDHRQPDAPRRDQARRAQGALRRRGQRILGRQETRVRLRGDHQRSSAATSA